VIRPLSSLLLATVAALGSAAPPAPPTATTQQPATAPAPPSGPAPLAERLGWNARERTRAGIHDLKAGHSDAAARSLDTALRLDPADPLAEFNAGTGRLAAGRPDAARLLEHAAAGAAPGLASDAWYNLGNARLAARDAHGAVEAYVQSLRRDPGRRDAKHNLELALRELDRQQRQQRAESSEQERKSGDRSRERERERSEQADARPSPTGSQNPSQPGGEERDPSSFRNQGAQSRTTRGEADRPSGASAQGAAAQPATRPRPDSALPGYRDQPDLDAKQAAALLRAVENLERQQRRQRALERARARGEQDIDW
jgi:Tfp pilus assembly protein PilF